jgi:hypothetical protein
MAQTTDLKCARCRGWAHEPGITPFTVCGDCDGTGVPRGAATGRRWIGGGRRG